MIQKIIEDFIKENHIPVINTDGYLMVSKEDLAKLLVKHQTQQLSIDSVSKYVTAKDLKCPKCKQHALMEYIDGKECTSCGYVC